MNRFKTAVLSAAGKARELGSSAFNRVKGAAFALAAVPTAGMLAIDNAHASGGGASLGAAMLAAVSGIEGDIRSILIVLVGVLGLFILYALIRKARG